MPKCSLCGSDFDLVQKGVTRKYCYKCSPIYSRRDKKSLSARQEAFRKAMREYGIAYLGGKCQKCGYNKCNAALAFHHQDPTQKEFNFGRGFLSFERFKKELDKCILLCANCHAEIHWKDY